MSASATKIPDFRQIIASLDYGKRLPGAVYIFRPRPSDVSPDLWATIRRAEIAAQPDPSWNLLKIHTDQFAVTFLSYPDFDTRSASGFGGGDQDQSEHRLGAAHRLSRSGPNPPILHRKETFLPPDDPRIPDFAALTKREEEAGLYRDPSRIGLRVQWLTLLKRLGLAYEGHTLVPFAKHRSTELRSRTQPADVARHRTAIKRYDLSKPVKQLLERGLLRKNGHVLRLRMRARHGHRGAAALGYQARVGTRHFGPTHAKTPAAVVNLGYVLNVIEEPAERIAHSARRMRWLSARSSFRRWRAARKRTRTRAHTAMAFSRKRTRFKNSTRRANSKVSSSRRSTSRRARWASACASSSETTTTRNCSRPIGAAAGLIGATSARN